MLEKEQKKKEVRNKLLIKDFSLRPWDTPTDVLACLWLAGPYNHSKATVYEDGRLQCKESRHRSIGDSIKVLHSYFPGNSEAWYIKEIFKAIFHINDNTNYKGVKYKSSHTFLYCTDINEVVLYQAKDVDFRKDYVMGIWSQGDLKYTLDRIEEGPPIGPKLEPECIYEDDPDDCHDCDCMDYIQYFYRSGDSYPSLYYYFNKLGIHYSELRTLHKLSMRGLYEFFDNILT